MSAPYTPPRLDSTAFNCPICNAYARQYWNFVYRNSKPVPQLRVADCEHCHETSIWFGDGMLYPGETTAPPANADAPKDICADYEEARQIVSRSPRGAAALLRLSVQKLCQHLGEKGVKIDDDIASLVKKGLPVTIQQALDAVRVVGNEAVHPGTMDIRDNMEMASAMFGLFNLIVENRISEPKRVKAIYDSLPRAKLDGIVNRDKPKPTKP